MKENGKIQVKNGADRASEAIEVSIDCVVFGYSSEGLQVLLIEIGAEKLKGSWALPGDILYADEDLDQAAARVLEDLTGLSNVPLQQAHAFGKVDRIPEKRVITVAYYAILNVQDVHPQAGNWASKAQWHSVHQIPQLTYDHNELVNYSITKLKNKLKHSIKRKPLWASVLPKEFTLSQLQHFYEVVLDKKLDKGNFRKKLNDMSYLIETDYYQQDVSHRPARLFRYDKKIHEKHVK